MDITKGYVPGVIGRIAELHALYYSLHAGFGLYFESKVACELSAFLGRYDEERDGLWLARSGDGVQGAIVIDGIDAAGEGAHLRWFIVSEAAAGQGIGGRLMASALGFCREKQYGKVCLWTFAGLDAARHLYEKNGFRLAHTQPGKQWGVAVTEQRFELSLG